MAASARPVDRTAFHKAGSRDVSQTGSQFEPTTHINFPDNLLDEDLDFDANDSPRPVSQRPQTSIDRFWKPVDRSEQFKTQEPWHNVVAIRAVKTIKAAPRQL
jgi:hypothetical protein